MIGFTMTQRIRQEEIFWKEENNYPEEVWIFLDLSIKECEKDILRFPDIEKDMLEDMMLCYKEFYKIYRSFV